MSTKTAAFLLLAATLAAPSLSAGSVSSQLSISVQVVARTLVTVDSQPATLDITPSDVARGYVEVPQAVAFHLRTNAANGYQLTFAPIGYPFAEAQVSWGSNVATVTNEGSWVTRPSRPGVISRTMNVRLRLAPGAQPGSYAWPVLFDAGSL